MLHRATWCGPGSTHYEALSQRAQCMHALRAASFRLVDGLAAGTAVLWSALRASLHFPRVRTADGAIL